MKITIAQLGVNQALATNLSQMMAVLEQVQSDEWVIFPEGVLSGYFPESPEYLSNLDAAAIKRGIDGIHNLVQAKNCNCIFGTALLQAGHWFNSAILLTHTGARFIHHKVELSELDRQVFSPGTEVNAVTIGQLTLGLQACRELIFPQTWSRLKAAGVQIVFHLNNAIQPHDALWEHILITRAVEQGIFVCSVNNGTAPQTLASYLIAPSGKVLLKTNLQQDHILSADINLSEVIPDLPQRTDY